LKTRFLISGLILVLTAMLAASCARVHVDPVEVKPIHIVLDVNIRVDRELEQFFAFESNPARESSTQPATVPASAHATQRSNP